MTEKGLKYLSDIKKAIELIEVFKKDTNSFEKYSKDFKTQSAIERQLSILGEAVNVFSKIHPEITLNNARKIVGFRNRLIHAYDGVDNVMIWAIINSNLDDLKIEVTKMLESNLIK